MSVYFPSKYIFIVKCLDIGNVKQDKIIMS